MIEFEEQIAAWYPHQPLRLVGFKFGISDKGRKINTVGTFDSMASLETSVKKGKLLIIPNRDIPLPDRATMALLQPAVHLRVCTIALLHKMLILKLCKET